MLLGLGIHKSLIGGTETVSGTANAFTGLRNMMKRIDAVRRSITSWIEEEVDIINNNLGFKNTPSIRFSINNLFDQTAYFRLLVDLNDRNIISNRTIIEKIGEMHSIEESRLDNERESRDSGDMMPKYSPFIQSEVPESNFQKELKLKNNNTTIKTSDGPAKDNEPKKRKGRPPGSKDTVTRNRRYKSKAYDIVLGDRIQDTIDPIIDQHYLVYNSLKNKRELSSAQRKELDKIKLQVLSCSENADIESYEDIEKILNSADLHASESFLGRFEENIRNSGSDLNQDDIKSIKSLTFAEMREHTQ